MLKCREVAEESGDYIDHTMPRYRALKIKLHLLVCSHCRRFISHLRMAVAFFRRLPDPELADEQARQIADSVTEKVQHGQGNPAP